MMNVIEKKNSKFIKIIVNVILDTQTKYTTVIIILRRRK